MKLDNMFGVHEQMLRLRSQRSEILASNIANADTPGYKARDIDFKAVFDKQASQAANVKTSQPGHMRSIRVGQSLGSNVSPHFIKFRNVDQPSLDGNTVDMQREQLHFAENSARFEATMRFLNGKIKGLQKAISGK